MQYTLEIIYYYDLVVIKSIIKTCMLNVALLIQTDRPSYFILSCYQPVFPIGDANPSPSEIDTSGLINKIRYSVGSNHCTENVDQTFTCLKV